MTIEPRMLDCGEHGTRPWLGDIVCGDCGAIYIAKKVEGGIDFNDVDDEGKCKCGAQLMPDKEHTEIEFTARSICRECALAGKPS